jgi:hypothetical protein
MPAARCGSLKDWKRRCALRLPGGDLQPLAPPDPLDPLVVDQPAGPAQQLRNLAIAIAAIPPGQLDDVGRQPLFILTAPRGSCAASSDAAQAPHRHAARRSTARLEHARCRRGDAGLSSFAAPPLAESACPTSGRTLRGAAGCSPSPVSSSVLSGRASGRRTLAAS